MNIYEVVFWSSPGHENPEKDTIFLVRAATYEAALEEIWRNVTPAHIGGRDPKPHAVYELGNDLSLAQAGRQQILRGPYFQSAYNCGWRAWYRQIEGADYGNRWEEENPWS